MAILIYVTKQLKPNNKLVWHKLTYYSFLVYLKYKARKLNETPPIGGTYLHLGRDCCPPSLIRSLRHRLMPVSLVFVCAFVCRLYALLKAGLRHAIWSINRRRYTPVLRRCCDAIASSFVCRNWCNTALNDGRHSRIIKIIDSLGEKWMTKGKFIICFWACSWLG